jgi:hypothetical protein
MAIVLHQDQGPVAFFSRAMAPHHAKLATYEHELIGLIEAVRHWRPYLWPREFVIRTDHFSLKYLLDQRLSIILQHHWVSKLFEYQFAVEFKPGQLNATADALSWRIKEELEVHALSVPTFELFDQFRCEAATLLEIVAKCANILAGYADEGWTITDDVVLF